ncbi:hypothetical protein [Georgenia yuyongxinii]
MVAKTEPEEIVDDEHEQLLLRVCAIDVAKDSGKVCVRVPSETGSGRRVSKVWDVPARTKAVVELGDHLACQAGVPQMVGKRIPTFGRDDAGNSSSGGVGSCYYTPPARSARGTAVVGQAAGVVKS